MPRNVHYVLSTHWDREWYQSFQNFRYRLVQLIDNIIAGWEDGRLQGPFQTDGQFIILEDYLEVREQAIDVEQRHQREDHHRDQGERLVSHLILPRASLQTTTR